MENRIKRIRFAAICALLLCAMAITARTATITVTNTNDSGPGSSTFVGDYSGIASISGVVIPVSTDIRSGGNQKACVARGVYPPGGAPTPTATPCASVGSWTEQAPYPIVISGNAVASQGGNVYSFGGIANNTAIANAYTYTPTTNTWTPIASLPAPRGWFSAASDGTYIYLLGGVDQNFTTTATLWRYDPATNTYNTSLPSYTIPTYFHASVYLNGKVYRIAGRAIGTDYHVEVYDIATNTWSMAANYPFANHSLMAVALDGYIYGGGGNASPDKTYRYDPSTDTWDDAVIADLPAGRSAAASGAYNGRWLLAGGDVSFAISNSVIAWDPATNTWNNLPNMVQARDYLAGATAGMTKPGAFYAVAGNSGPGTPTNDNQQYTETPCATPTPTPTPTATPTATPTPTPTPGVITLSAHGRRVQGRQTVDLFWSGSNAASIDIYRNGVVIATVPNTGTYKDFIGVRGGNVRYTYKVCEASTQNCSNEVTVRFGGPPL
jgi:N-acetylneuraminic acid mutarotase